LKRDIEPRNRFLFKKRCLHVYQGMKKDRKCIRASIIVGCKPAKASLNGVLCTLNMLMWRYSNEERDDKSFMGVHCFQNIDMLETGL